MLIKTILIPQYNARQATHIFSHILNLTFPCLLPFHSCSLHFVLQYVETALIICLLTDYMLRLTYMGYKNLFEKFFIKYTPTPFSPSVSSHSHPLFHSLRPFTPSITSRSRIRFHFSPLITASFVLSPFAQITSLCGVIYPR